MEFIGTSASITALIQLAGTVIQYLSAVKGAIKDRQKLVMELWGINDMLYVLNEQAREAHQSDEWSSTLLSLDKPNGPIEQLKKALERLKFKLAPAGGLRKVGKAIAWPFQKEEIKEIFGLMERQKTLLHLARQNDHIGLCKAIKGDVASLRGEFAQLCVDSRSEKIRRWLVAPDPSSNYNNGLKQRCLKTGSWFVESEVFANWKSSPGSFVWLFGIPGCGKTILNSVIVEDLMEHCSREPTLAVLYFYFDFNDVEKQGQEKMIRSLILQLVSQCRGIPQSLEALYSSSLNGERQPTYETLLTTLHQMMESFAETYIVLDALDECSDRQDLLEAIEAMNLWTDTHLHILSTSRREKEIEERIGPLASDRGKICIDKNRIHDDIRTYVHERLRIDPQLKKWRKEQKVQQEIEDTLIEKADGMFRWAACQLDTLRSCLSVRELRKSLASLPKDLDETYARILDKLDGGQRRDALKILQWLTYSARPLRLQEVAEVVAIDVDEDPRFDPEKRYQDPQDIWTICSSLISLDEDEDEDEDDEDDEDDDEVEEYEQDEEVEEYEQDEEDEVSRDASKMLIVRLAHFSVKEYLISPRIRRSRVKDFSIPKLETHALIANSSIAYLLQFDEPDSLTARAASEFPLANYAAEYWTDHARIAERHADFTPILCMELLLTKGHGFLNWIRLYNIDDPYRPSSLSEIDPSERLCLPLYYASLAGLIKSVKRILDVDGGTSINAQGGMHNNALQAASAEGHELVVQILLANGADVNALGNMEVSKTALQAASVRGYIEIVRILLDNGADINTQGGADGNALQAASVEGDKETVQLLLDSGADINAQGGEYSNALQAASAEHYIEIVRILLDNGADINAQGGYFGNALQAASVDGYIAIVQLLLDSGADINAQGGEYGTALQAASTGGHNETVQTLLGSGADINAQGGYFGNALQAASVDGYIAIVQLLLDSGAEINAQGGEYGNALQAASVGGYTATVQLLVDRGADIDAQGGKYGNALNAAIRYDHEEIAQMLLDHGAETGRV